MSVSLKFERFDKFFVPVARPWKHRSGQPVPPNSRLSSAAEANQVTWLRLTYRGVTTKFASSAESSCLQVWVYFAFPVGTRHLKKRASMLWMGLFNDYLKKTHQYPCFCIVLVQLAILYITFFLFILFYQL